MLRRLWLFFFLSMLGLAFGQDYIKSVNAQQQESFLFEENKGQLNEVIKYRSDLPNGEMYLCKGKFVYQYYDIEKYKYLLQANHSGDVIENPIIQCHNYEVKFEGSNSDVLVTAEEPTVTEYNYFIGNNPEKWASKVKKYKKVIYTNLYDEIDLIIYSFYNTVKYEFRVYPGGNPGDITMKFNGLDSLFDFNGMLGQATSVGTIYDQQPYSYQLLNGEQIEIGTAFKVANNVAEFGVENYNEDELLVIDPQLIFATYSGSTADNWGNTACLDNQGNLYSGGTVFNFRSGTSTASGVGKFPATLGAFETIFQGGDTDIGILKFDSSGAQLLYATYLGGNSTEIPTSIITNDQDELFILSMSGSSDFPMPNSNAFDTSYGGGDSRDVVGGYAFNDGSDIVISKLSADGSTIVNATYIGGSRNDGIATAPFLASVPTEHFYADQLRGDIQVDEDNNLYIASVSSSSDFPTSIGALQDTFGGGLMDGVLIKLSSDFESLLWSTYVGGAGEDNCLAVELSSNGGVYFGGGTNSGSEFIPLNGLYNNPLGDVDGYVAQITDDGMTIVRGTRLGTPEFDQAYFVDVDSRDNIYVFGLTEGPYEINGAVYRADSFAGQFIHKLTPELDSTEYSFVFGNSGTATDVPLGVSPTAFLVNECANIFVSGWGGIPNVRGNQLANSVANMPLTNNAYQSTTDGRDFYFGVFSADGAKLIYGTYYGGTQSGEHVDGGTSRFDKSGIIYQSVCAGCGSNDDFVTQEMIDDPLINVYSATNNSSNCNNGVIKFDLANVIAQINTENVCIEDDVTFENTTVGGQVFIWNFGDGSPEEVYTDRNGVSHSYDTLGSYLVQLIVIDSSTCKIADTTSFEVRVYEPNPESYEFDTICLNDLEGVTVPIYANDDTYLWEPDTGLSSTTIPNPTATGIRNIIYSITVTDTIGCVRIDTLDLTVPIINDTLDFELFNSCDLVGKPRIEILSLGGHETDTVFVIWDFGDGTTSDEWNPSHTYDEEGVYTVTLQASYGKCNWDTSFTVDLDDFNIPNIFTPNNDGKNDTFKILRTEDSDAWEFSFYNRWGKLLYKNEDYHNEYSADGVNDGTYYYLIVAPDGTKCKNWVQLTR